MLSKNTCVGVHFIVKLQAISLPACKLLKMNFFTHIFEGFQLDFKLLFIVLFLGIISWKGGSCFNGEFVFQMGGFIFKWGWHLMGEGISFDGGRGGGGFKKNSQDGGCSHAPPLCETLLPLPFWSKMSIGQDLMFSSERNYSTGDLHEMIVKYSWDPKEQYKVFLSF